MLMSVGSFTNQYYKLVHYTILIFNQITYVLDNHK